MIVSCVFCCQICSLACFLSLDRSCIPLSFHCKCCNKLASLITWFSLINVCKSLLSVLYSTVVDLADPFTAPRVCCAGNVTGMYGVFNNYVQCLTEALFKSYDISISFATFFDKKSYIFITQMKPLHSLFNSYVCIV